MAKKTSFAHKASRKNKNKTERSRRNHRGGGGHKQTSVRMGGHRHPSSRRAFPDSPVCRGIFHGTSRGFGFITPEVSQENAPAEDLFVPACMTGGAIDGDLVSYRAESKKKFGGENERNEAAVVEVIERRTTTLIAEFCVEAHIRGRKTVRRLYAVPENKKFAFEIEISSADSFGAVRGDKILLELTDYPTGEHVARGRVLRIFGAKESRAANYAAILFSHEIPTIFPDDVLTEAEEVAARRITSRGRVDLRGDIIFTIDSADAKDLDDAISLKRTEQGWQLGVHIADVSYYVRSGSAIDREAMARGTSVYFTDQVVPMLPVALSNGCCSLNGGVNRYAMSALLDLAPDGSLRGCEIVQSIIRSNVRGVYSEVNDLFAWGEKSEFAGKYAAVLPTLADMRELYRLLAARAASRGALELDMAEAKIIVDEQGEPVDIIRRERGDAERMIEQFMLAANEGVARWLSDRGLPCVYRVHEKPLAEKMQAFAEYAMGLGLPVGRLGQGSLEPTALAADLRRVLSAAAERDMADAVSIVLLRSLQKARYATQPLGHFGLGIAQYCHFTSPIRRYPDLAVHRIIRAALSGKAAGRELDRLTSFAEHAAKASSENELRALMAEREIEDLYKTIYLSAHVGEVFDARITSVAGFGLFAELENTCEGLIPITSLDGFFVFDEKNYRLTCGSRIYRVGDCVRVRIESADISSHQVEMRLIEQVS
ncbi:MAG: ribonuclease R [Clostridia bacterium]|nr:ribonuclease R [Clostridia bacterium]